MTTPTIKLESIEKSFGSKTVLSGINLEVPKGQSLVIIGGSGTGKSVLLKCILNIITPDRGRVFIAGQDVTKIPLHRRMRPKFGMLFQGGALFDSLKVWENISFAQLQAGDIGRKQARELALEKLHDVGLSAEVSDLFPVELSGGMQKRVGLARAIANDPEVIFFDEPTSGLDPIMSGLINKLIRKIVDNLGATTITITHDMTSAQYIGDEIAMLHKGAVLWKGPSSNVKQSNNAYVDQFINGYADGPLT
jgi:phospholipid/cholesterol/gamma-HCH transport system ATP-binding protein